MTCDLCNGTGYRMVDVGTATIPDYIEARCACNPAPTDAEYDDCGYPGETPYPADSTAPPGAPSKSRRISRRMS